MTNGKLINRIDRNKVDSLVYNTACLKVTDGNDFNTVYQQLLDFVSETVKEKDCIEFFVSPSNVEKNEFMLWEVWGNTEAFNSHMEQEHTKALLSKNIIELKWNEFVASLQTHPS